MIEVLARSFAEEYNRHDDLVCSPETPSVRLLTFQDNEFEMLLREILDNAFKFSVAGEKVTISGSMLADHYVLRISDQGRGMSDGNIRDIGVFEQFGRNFHEQQGIGLGLTLAQLISGLNGYDFKISRNSGPGITVSIGFPVRPNPEQSGEDSGPFGDTNPSPS
jgi:two-component system, sensor histidine kinase and response regulator